MNTGCHAQRGHGNLAGSWIGRIPAASRPQGGARCGHEECAKPALLPDPGACSRPSSNIQPSTEKQVGQAEAQERSGSAREFTRGAQRGGLCSEQETKQPGMC